MGLSALEFWLLTAREFRALKARWDTAHGIKPPMTAEEKANLAFQERYILEQKQRAWNRKIAADKARAASRLQVVRERVERRANG